MTSPTPSPPPGQRQPTDDERATSLPISTPASAARASDRARRLSSPERARDIATGTVADASATKLDVGVAGATGQGSDEEGEEGGGEARSGDEGDEANESAGRVTVGASDLPQYAWVMDHPPRLGRGPNAYDSLHPFVQLLSVADLDDCVRVEASFPPHERCSREKIRYRLTRCPELSLGIFTLPPKSEWKDGRRPERATLIGHIISTRTHSPVVTDNTMELPKDWESKSPSPPSSPGSVLGHEEGGSTVALHSLAVLTEHQGKKLGSILMKSYVQRIGEAATAKRIALLAHDHLIPFYESFGFRNKGKSACKFGGGGWYDMVLEFRDDTDSETSL